jgi:hypothetical protein
LRLLEPLSAVAVYTTAYFQKERVVTVSEKAAGTIGFVFRADESLPDLTYAAENSVKAVVHIQTEYTSNKDTLVEFDFRFLLWKSLPKSGTTYSTS